ncbi:hydrogenase maturation nickel metallochaperone HypA [Candidatus Chloroploca sp. Khr17]|uniref:hydrogenase maturation nickel metallochaperone HypA/HybF n=1 Tax=Candidatus Chloroploca sp. Khr17 TaxID=2496869 RepID=UPI00101C7BAC|nr:hydrogenase maturation nickel metallochaperone HypA [Candidatus Chloroploca sp. Khr17]
MHELAITEGLLKVAVGAADGRRIRSISLVIGALSSVVDDSVQFYFDILSRESAAEGAQLVFRRIPADGICLACGTTTLVTPPLPLACAACGSRQLRVTGGDQFQVESIEVDDP